jgi:hypothetical protein
MTIEESKQAIVPWDYENASDLIVTPGARGPKNAPVKSAMNCIRTDT